MLQELKSFLGFLFNMIALSITVIILLATGVVITALCLSWVAIPACVYFFDLSPWWVLLDIPVLTLCYIAYFSAKDYHYDNNNEQ